MQNHGNFQQVFAVTELPPVSQSLDLEALSGKESNDMVVDFMSSEDDEVKHDYPEIESTTDKAILEDRSEEASESTASEECSLDENDPTLSLFASPRKAITTQEPEEFESLFGDIASEKVFAHFELFVSTDSDNERLMYRFERMRARLESRSRRLDNLLADYL